MGNASLPRTVASSFKLTCPSSGQPWPTSHRPKARSGSVMSDRYETGDLRGLAVESGRRAASEPAVASVEEAVSKLGGRVLPDEDRFFDRCFVLEGELRR